MTIDKLPSAKEMRDTRKVQTLMRQHFIHRLIVMARTANHISNKDFEGLTKLSKALIKELEEKGYEVRIGTPTNESLKTSWAVKWNLPEESDE